MANPQNQKGISLQGFIPVRKDPFERSEMVTQILFGESLEILDDEARWLYIRTDFDTYEGWIDKKCIEILEEAEYEPIYLVCRQGTKVKNLSANTEFILPAGAVIPKIKGKHFQLAGTEFELIDPSQLIKPGELPIRALIQEIMHVPYIWGGRSGYGFDCSGLTQYLCRAIGKNIPRDAGDQSAQGSTLSFISEAKEGDLAFFDDTEGMIHHVGMILEEKRLIHASGMVRTDRIDQQGIFNEQKGEYTHKLRVLKRV